ncbi:hypothetical protein P7C65_06s1g08300 [Encephalitozoon intestinalis]
MQFIFFGLPILTLNSKMDTKRSLIHFGVSSQSVSESMDIMKSKKSYHVPGMVVNDRTSIHYRHLKETFQSKEPLAYNRVTPRKDRRIGNRVEYD